MASVFNLHIAFHREHICGDSFRTVTAENHILKRLFVVTGLGWQHCVMVAVEVDGAGWVSEKLVVLAGRNHKRVNTASADFLESHCTAAAHNTQIVSEC